MRYSNIWLFTGLFLWSCKPAEQTSSRGSLSGVQKLGDPSSEEVDDLTIDREANFSVPVSGTNLTFAVSKDTQASSIEAYIVGFSETRMAARGQDDQWIITDVPAEAKEIIITGLSADSAASSTFDRGLRMPIGEPKNAAIDLGTIDLPKTGSRSGLAEMEGVAGFASVRILFPGTRLAPVTPDANGAYTMSNMPVGMHEITWQQKDNPQGIKAEARIQSAIAHRNSLRDLVRSIPNSPSNIRIRTSDSSVALSWISGGGNASGYLVYRGSPNDTFQPVNGQSYVAGKSGAGFIVANSAQPLAKDTQLTIGTSYLYKVFAYNQDLVYSAPRSVTATTAANPLAFRKFRFHVDSVSNECQGQGTAQIQALNFYIDKVWQTNDFTSNSNSGTIGPYPVQIAVNNMYNNAYDAFFAFQDDNLAWSSSFKSFAQTSPYDVLSNKHPDGIYFDIDFGTAAVNIEGLEILGGEPPFFPECAPDSYRLLGSNDGSNWTPIPGSARQENTQARLRYYFQMENRPLTPIRFHEFGNDGQIQLSWESAAGTEIGYLLVRSMMPEPFIPENGKAYGMGAIDGGYEVMVDSSALSYTDTSFSDKTRPYYYTLLAYDSNRQYSPSVVGRATPDKRQTYRFYRLVVLSILGGGPTMSWMDSLQLQIDGTWTDDSLGGYAVTLKESSANGTNTASGLFGPGYWQTAKDSFQTAGMDDAAKKGGEYVQLDFGAKAAAITGYRAFGNNAIDGNGRYSSSMYYQVPDLVRMERSQDGINWEIIDGSLSWYSMAQTVEMVW